MVKSLLQHRRPGFNPWVGKILWRRKWQPTPVFLPGKSHGQRSLAGYSLWGHKELDTTEQLHFTSLQTQETVIRTSSGWWKAQAFLLSGITFLYHERDLISIYQTLIAHSLYYECSIEDVTILYGHRTSVSCFFSTSSVSFSSSYYSRAAWA